ncbi:MAG: DUF2973 domain-containing protein [Gemmatimonadaceae bacterium]|nr:DUF2973 domain-containing protein [Gloeobacterales cyanobacterium ES-bin-141]
MLFQILYLIVFCILGVLAFWSMSTGWRTNRSVLRQSRGPETRPHPELLDSQGRLIRDPLLVVRVTPREEEIRHQLEALYRNSPDTNSPDRSRDA